MAVRVNERKRSTKNDPGIGNVANWQRGARQVRSFFDDFLGGNPSWNNGLRQLQQQNPGYANGAEDLESFFTGTRKREIKPPKGEPGKPTRSASGELARARNRQNADRVNQSSSAADEGVEGLGQRSGLSLAEALAQALELLPGGGGVNYDPQRQALRERAGDADSRLEAMYRQLQGSYAADAPVIDAAYDTAQSGVNTATDQGVTNINNAYDKARADQTAQLTALGIGDAAATIAGAGQDAGAQQAAAVGNLEQNRGANVNQLETDQRASGAYNTRIGQAAGLEGNLSRATNQSRLQQLLAEIDAQEQQENASLTSNNRSAAMSLAGQLVNQDQFERQYADSRADADFDKQIQTQQLVSKLQGQTAARFDPQQAISSTDSYFEANGITPTPDEWNKVFGNMIRNYSVGY